MSVVGISPSDIVGGLRVTIKAISALKRQNGAQEQYQTVKEGHDDLHTAVRGLSETFAPHDLSGSRELKQTLDHLSKIREREEVYLDRYKRTLGEVSPRQKRRETGRKLQWAFQGEGVVRDSTARSRPIVMLQYSKCCSK